MILVEGDAAYDTDFAMFYTLYHIFKQESIQGSGRIKGRGMIKGRHLALYQIFKTTVFTTKYMIKECYHHVYCRLKSDLHLLFMTTGNYACIAISH